MHLAEIVSNVNCVAETNGSPGEGLRIFLAAYLRLTIGFPKAIVLDNGSGFAGRALEAVYRQLAREDVRLGGAGIRRGVPHAKDVGVGFRDRGCPKRIGIAHDESVAVHA